MEMEIALHNHPSFPDWLFAAERKPWWKWRWALK
jgi:hypothetical protein